MKNRAMPLISILAILLLTAALSGCGRVNRTTLRDQNQIPPAVQSTSPEGMATVNGNGNPGSAAPTATVSSQDSQGDDLLNLISTLEAANQAGDPLDDLP
jgi:outer membrane lipopolysaccharide assembly protein LptE/RlpB